jgi:potassium-transporting ATPase KdpC subunit
LSLGSEIKRNYGPALRLAAVSLLICGLVFPLVVTGFAQALFPDQANGSIAHLSNNGRAVGSYLIAQNFSLPFFFHPRNSSLSASGVDPDILLDDALAQVPRISNATGIAQTDIKAIVNSNIEGTLGVFGYPYVNVLRLNLALVQNYPAIYQGLGYGK